MTEPVEQGEVNIESERKIDEGMGECFTEEEIRARIFKNVKE